MERLVTDGEESMRIYSSFLRRSRVAQTFASAKEEPHRLESAAFPKRKKIKKPLQW